MKKMPLLTLHWKPNHSTKPKQKQSSLLNIEQSIENVVQVFKKTSLQTHSKVLHIDLNLKGAAWKESTWECSKLENILKFSQFKINSKSIQI